MNPENCPLACLVPGKLNCVPSGQRGLAESHVCGLRCCRAGSVAQAEKWSASPSLIELHGIHFPFSTLGW